MTSPTPVPVVEVESLVKRVVTDAAVVAAAVLVVLGALPAVLSGLNAAHLDIPGWVTTYATLATAALTGFVSWARNRGFVTTKTPVA